MPMPPLEQLSMRVFLSEARVYAALNATSVYAGKVVQQGYQDQAYADMATLQDCGAIEDYVDRSVGVGTCVYRLSDILDMLHAKHYYAEAKRLRAAFMEVDWPDDLYIEVI